MVPVVTGAGSGGTNTTAKTRRSSRKSRGRGSSSAGKSDTTAQCMGHLGPKKSNQQVSERVAYLQTNSRALATRNSYNSAWKKFSRWCHEREADPIQCPLRDILDFLASLFDEKYSHSAIGNARSAISAYHNIVDGWPVWPVDEGCEPSQASEAQILHYLGC